MVKIKSCLLFFVQHIAWSPRWSFMRGKITEKFPVCTLKKWLQSPTKGGLLREVTNMVIWLRDKTVLWEVVAHDNRWSPTGGGLSWRLNCTILLILKENNTANKVHGICINMHTRNLQWSGIKINCPLQRHSFVAGEIDRRPAIIYLR